MLVRLINTSQPAVNIDFTKPELKPGHKPYAKNLAWYGLGEEWVEWAARHVPNMLRSNLFEIQVDESKICRLNNAGECLEFTQRFGVPGTITIDWEKAAQKWAGIEISRECLEDYYDKSAAGEAAELTWLEGWDVGSGCIWNASAITGSKPYSTLSAIFELLPHAGKTPRTLS